MSEPKQPKLAGTVILLRPAERQGVEVFLTRRPEGMPFLGGMYCFPGGTANKQDFSPRMIQRCAGLTAKRARQILGAHLRPAEALGLWVTGVRELFEEVGVLLAVETSGETMRVDAARQARLMQRHTALVNGTLSFAEFLELENLLCDLANLHHFSHWQTPAQVAMRFDTHFFLTVLPEGQTPLSTSYEVAHSVWLSADRALQLFGRGELPMIFPTFAALRTLADFATIDGICQEFQPQSAGEH
jgi:8-oxo-dGTP pyrophosphatase MutT (NUDIX family)